MWVIKPFEELTAGELHLIYKERTTVFVVEQNCPYQELMQVVLEYAKTHFSGLPIHAQAQAYLQAFYASFGFHPVSEIYLEDDIPHIDMIIATHRN